MSLNNTTCCGIKEFYGVNGVRDSFKELLKNYDGSSKKFGLIIFSCNDGQKESSDGDKLAGEIEKAGLGRVLISSAVRNPNTGRTIKHFVWEIDHMATAKFSDAYFAEERAEEKRKKEERDKIVAENLARFKVGDYVVVNKEKSKHICPGNNFIGRFGRMESLDKNNVGLCLERTLERLKARHVMDWIYYTVELQYLDIIDPDTGKVIGPKSDTPIEKVKRTVKRKLKKIL